MNRRNEMTKFIRDPERMHTFRMTESKAELVHAVVSSHMEALKNWIVGAVESGNLPYAQELATQLRDYQTLYAAFNIDAKYTIAEHSPHGLTIEHDVREGRFM
jgi:hypothetical protein